MTGFVGEVDLVVANPPYLSKKEMIEVQPELLFEPNIALYGGLSGWEKSVELIESTCQIIKDGGKAFFETSPECIDSITGEICKNKNVNKLESHVDYSGNNRIIELSF